MTVIMTVIVLQCKPGDLRANAFTQCDAFAGQICLALPNKHYFLSLLPY